MELETITKAVHDAASVRRVFGDPIEVDGVTIIPVARAGGGGGGGRGGPSDTGGEGGGFGVGANPVGAYVVRDGHVSFVPTIDYSALASKAALVLVVALLTRRSVARARHRRKAREARYER